MAISCRDTLHLPAGSRSINVRSAVTSREAQHFVPSVAGLIIAGEVIKDLTRDVRVTAESVENQQ